jgi:putative DNA primase/helicase
MADSQLPEDLIVRLEEVRKQKQTQRPAAAPAVPPEFSDDALALRFAELHRDTLRHVAGWGKWLLWRRSHWQTDDTLRVFDLARAICRDASASCPTERVAAAAASAKTVAAVVSLARSDRRLAETIDAWDRNQGRLNTLKATINLAPQPGAPH